MLTPRVMPTPIPASAPEVSPSELGFCVTVDVGGGAEVVEVELLDGFDELNVLLTGTAGEGDRDTETALPLCCVTVPSCIMTNPLPASQQPRLPGTFCWHQLPSLHGANGTSVPLSANRSSSVYDALGFWKEGEFDILVPFTNNLMQAGSCHVGSVQLSLQYSWRASL
jgi:hypothetical protein